MWILGTLKNKRFYKNYVSKHVSKYVHTYLHSVIVSTLNIARGDISRAGIINNSLALLRGLLECGYYSREGLIWGNTVGTCCHLNDTTMFIVLGFFLIFLRNCLQFSFCHPNNTAMFIVFRPWIRSASSTEPSGNCPDLWKTRLWRSDQRLRPRTRPLASTQQRPNKRGPPHCCWR